jgi:hypothetical protein
LCAGIYNDKLKQIEDEKLLSGIDEIRKNPTKINTGNAVYTASQEFLKTVVTSPVTTDNVLYKNAHGLTKQNISSSSTYTISYNAPIFICNNVMSDNDRLSISLIDDDSLINDDCTVYNFGKLNTVKVE